MNWFTSRKPPADPLAPGLLRCAYCTSDYIEWETTHVAGVPAPPVRAALTILPATVDGIDGAAAVCVAHYRPMQRTLMSKRRRLDKIRQNGATPAQRSQPMPRIVSGTAQS